jgi:hypothetical protein
MGFLFATPTFAQGDADRTAVQAVIEQQIQAFLRDDGETAYSFAAPSIQQMFPTADIFMEMVRGGYQPVYRPRSHVFGELKASGGGLEQVVEIVDADGEYWTAHYTLELIDGAWRITGCYLEKAPGKVA